MRNNTHGVNTSLCNVNIPLPIHTYIDIFLFVFSVFTFIVGVIAWIFIRKCRWFKNYILLSIILNNAINAAIRNINVQCFFATRTATNLKTVFIVYYILYIYFKATLNYWLLILCYVFYLDLAKVYNNHISKRYLKANVFGWVLPLGLTIFNFIVVNYITRKPLKYALPIQITIMFIPLLMNAIIYSIIVFALIKKKPFDHNNVSRCRCFLLLTVILFLSGIFMLTIPLHQLWEVGKYVELVFLILSRLQDLISIVYFFTVSYNWSAWKNYCSRRSKMRNDIANLGSLNTSLS